MLTQPFPTLAPQRCRQGLGGHRGQGRSATAAAVLLAGAGLLGAGAAHAAATVAGVAPAGGFARSCATASGSGTTTFPDAVCVAQEFDALAGGTQAATQNASSGPGISNAASSTVTLGEIKLASSNTAPNGAFFPAAGAEGGFADSLIVSSPGTTGTGYLLVQVKVDGLLHAASGFAPSTSFTVTGYKDGLQLMAGNPGFYKSGSDLISTDRQYGVWGLAPVYQDVTRSIDDVITFSVPFTFNQSFKLLIWAQAFSGLRSVSGVAGSSSASSDFSHTVSWAGVAGVLTPGQTLNGGYTLMSLSGTDWSGPVGQVPEPAAWLTLLAGLGLVARAARRR